MRSTLSYSAPADLIRENQKSCSFSVSRQAHISSTENADIHSLAEPNQQMQTAGYFDETTLGIAVAHDEKILLQQLIGTHEYVTISLLLIYETIEDAYLSDRKTNITYCLAARYFLAFSVRAGS